MKVDLLKERLVSVTFCTIQLCHNPIEESTNSVSESATHQAENIFDES